MPLRKTLHTCALIALTSLVLTAAEVPVSVPGKNVHSASYMSNALGEERRFNFLLPDDYDTSTRRYPVLYLLHGYGDDNTAWSYMTNLSHYGSAHQIIIVMPDASKSFYINSASDPKAKFEDMIMKDLIPYVDAHLRTIPLPRARAVAGLSMGGYGAAFLGLKHYDKFAALGSFSGAVEFSHGPAPKSKTGKPDLREELDPMFGSTPAERDARDPFFFAAKVPAAQMPMIYIACGGQDFLIQENRNFVAFLAEKKIPYEYREISPRVHSWDFWDDQVRVFLDKLDELPGFQQH